MNAPAKPEIIHSACPHDCPSTCALEVERLDARTIGRVRGADANSYTAGVICAKVARYAERAHHPDRLLHPMRRVGAKGEGRFEPISWDDALDEVAEQFLKAEQTHGAEAVWPYFYAGTMGLVMRDGIERLRHAKKYSRMYATFCTTLSFAGFIAGTGKLAGADPREMAKSDVVVIWGTNPVHTQVNVMTHVTRARKDRNAKIVVVDVYNNPTAQQADMFICVRPGTDGALACAVMHVLFRDGYADWDYLNQFTDRPKEFAEHLKDRTPEWGSNITGVPVEEIEAFAKLIGENKRTFLRLGYGFTRTRNGAVNMHAASAIAAVTGAWQHEGGGAFHNNGAIYHWDKTLIEGLDVRDSSTRLLDQARIGHVLTGDKRDLGDGPPVTAMILQNTNPALVAPNQNLVRQGFSRDDLFTCVHEQFPTETVAYADIVLPATMFVEHDDLYQAGGHQHIQLGPKIIDAPGECRSNHDVICALAKRLGAEHRGFDMSVREIIDETLKLSGWPDLSTLEREHWIDVQPDFRTAHYLDGFAHADGKFHFSPDWSKAGPIRMGRDGVEMPEFPDHMEIIEEATDDMPFRLVTAPARNYLNSSFTETPTSIKREAKPRVKLHPEDAAQLGIEKGGRLRLGNDRGDVVVEAEPFEGLRRGVLVVEGIWPSAGFEEGIGINALVGADPGAPIGGACFHDNRVWVRVAE